MQPPPIHTFLRIHYACRTPISTHDCTGRLLRATDNLHRFNPITLSAPIPVTRYRYRLQGKKGGKQKEVRSALWLVDRLKASVQVHAADPCPPFFTLFFNFWCIL